MSDDESRIAVGAYLDDTSLSGASNAGVARVFRETLTDGYYSSERNLSPTINGSQPTTPFLAHLNLGAAWP